MNLNNFIETANTTQKTTGKNTPMGSRTMRNTVSKFY
jgi:hypothetical protein